MKNILPIHLFFILIYVTTSVARAQANIPIANICESEWRTINNLFRIVNAYTNYSRDLQRNFDRYNKQTTQEMEDYYRELEQPYGPSGKPFFKVSPEHGWIHCIIGYHLDERKKISVSNNNYTLSSTPAYRQHPPTWQPPANVVEGPASNTAFSLTETQETQDSPARHAAAKKEIQDFDNLVKKRRKGEDASYCVKGPFPSPGFWIFKNACPFNINFAYCNYKPTPDSWESAIDCEKGQFGSSDIEAHGERAAHAKASPGGTFGAACKDPSFPVKLVFLGNRINADCF